jgi:hypothetical protein
MLRWSAGWAVRGLVAAAVVAAAGGLLMVIWQGPWWLDGRRLIDKDLTGPAATLITGFRTAVVQVLVALGAMVALVYTARNYRLTRRGQVTDRFIKALERLGSDEMYVRYGGVLALEQIVQDAPDQAAHAAQVLGALIRRRVPVRQQHPDPPGEGLAAPKHLAEDVQAALTVMTRPASRRRVPRDQPINLPGRQLSGAVLQGADLSRARLLGADLSGAVLVRADLSGAQLDRAGLSGAWLNDTDLSGAVLLRTDLSGARLNDADLSGAVLTGADLSGAQLDRADLTGAELNDADLTSAKGLTVTRVVAARPTSTTRLPAAIAAAPAVVARIAVLAAEHAVQ